MNKHYEVFVTQVGGLRGQVSVSVGGTIVGTMIAPPSLVANMDDLQALVVFIEDVLNKEAKP